MEAQAEVHLAEVLQGPLWFGLGVGVEQARPVTLADLTEFFTNPAVQVILDGLVDTLAGQSERALVTKHLDYLRERIRNGVSSQEFKLIESRLTAVVRESGGEFLGRSWLGVHSGLGPLFPGS